MSESLKIVSPIDGSLYAERPVARDADIDSAGQLDMSRQTHSGIAGTP